MPKTFLAYYKAKLPNPPKPAKSIHSPGRTPDSFKALYVVTPAHVIEEAAAESNPSGTLAA